MAQITETFQMDGKAVIIKYSILCLLLISQCKESGYEQPWFRQIFARPPVAILVILAICNLDKWKAVNSLFIQIRFNKLHCSCMNQTHLCILRSYVMLYMCGYPLIYLARPWAVDDSLLIYYIKSIYLSLPGIWASSTEQYITRTSTDLCKYLSREYICVFSYGRTTEVLYAHNKQLILYNYICPLHMKCKWFRNFLVTWMIRSPCMSK